MPAKVVTWTGMIALLAAVWALYGQIKIQTLKKKLLAAQDRAVSNHDQLTLYKERDQLLFEKASEAMFLFAREEGKLLDANAKALQLLGYSAQEIKTLSFRNLFSREQKQTLLQLVNQAKETGRATVEDVKIRRKDGTQFVGQVQLKTGHLEGVDIVYGSFQNITTITNLQQELRRHNRHLSLLNEISQRVAEGHDLSQTLEIILDEVIKSFSISGGGIFLLSQRGTEMTLAVHRNIPEDVIGDLGRIKPGMGLVGQVVQTRRPRLSTNLMNDHRRISSAVLADQWRAFVAVPFIAEEETLGALFVFDRGKKVFSREELRLIQAIGRQLGPIVKNAELLDELQWQSRLNVASMRELERSRAKLRSHLDQLEQNHRSLQSLNHMKSSFLSLASHELRTPLTTIMSGAEFLEESAGDNLGENQQRALNVIIEGSKRLNHIVDNLLEAAKLEAKSLYMAREAFSPYLMIKGLVSEQLARCEARDLTLEITQFPEHAVIRGDIHHLKRAFERLLENAEKFTPAGGWIRVSGQEVERPEVDARQDKLKPFSEHFFESSLAEKYLQISITDNGIGLAPEDQLRIFDKFHEVGDISTHSSSSERFGGKGVGLGLTLVKGIIETHDGLIWVKSDGPGWGSCFSMLLPLSDPSEGKHVLG
jgi:PAS domain S-box-containing protein